MGAAREKDQADFDLETFVDLFDTAMSSDNPAVQKALRNLIMIAAIVNAEDKDAAVRQGPLRRMLDDQKNIIRRLQDLENKQSWSNPNTYPFTPGTPSPNIPAGPYVSPNTVPIPGQPWWGTGTGATYSVGSNQTTATDISTNKYNTLLNTLETK
jgi:hypothetical protein